MMNRNTLSLILIIGILGCDSVYQVPSGEEGGKTEEIPHAVEETNELVQLPAGAVALERTLYLTASDWLSFSPDGKHVVVVWENGPADVYEAETGKFLARAEYRNVFRVRRRRDTPCVWVNRGGKGSIICGVHSGATNLIATWTEYRVDKSVVFVWDAATGEEVARYDVNASQLFHLVAFSPDGTRIVSAGPDWSVSVWNARTGEVLTRCEQPKLTRVHAVAFGPDGKLVASAGFKQIRIWDADTGELAQTLDLPEEYHPHKLIFSADGKRLTAATLEDNEFVAVYDLDSAARIFLAKGADFWKHRLIEPLLTADGQRFCVVPDNEPRAIKLWDTTRGLQPFALAIECEIRSLAFSPNGSLLAVGGDDGAIRLFDASKGVQLHALRGHTGSVTKLKFAPDSRKLLSYGTDRKAYIWETNFPWLDPDSDDGPTDAATTDKTQE